MSTSTIKREKPRALRARVTRVALVVDLTDGRTVTVPLSWYPRLKHGTTRERARWRRIARGEGLHWPDLDEDVSVENLLAGVRSRESRRSYARWRATHALLRRAARTRHRKN